MYDEEIIIITLSLKGWIPSAKSDDYSKDGWCVVGRRKDIPKTEFTEDDRYNYNSDVLEDGDIILCDVFEDDAKWDPENVKERWAVRVTICDRGRYYIRYLEKLRDYLEENNAYTKT